MQPRSIAAIVVGLIVAGAIIGSRLQSKNHTGIKMKADAYELITHIDGFEKDRPYYISLLDAAHEQAFEDNYHISYGKRNRSTFDPNTYIEEVFTLMSQKATADGSTHIATNLDTYYHETILGEDPPARPKTPPPRK